MDMPEFLRQLDQQHIVGIVGDLGDGKSIVGVAIVSILRTLSLATKTPWGVSSNVPLKYPHDFVKYYDQLTDIEQSLIFMDEIHLIADSRNSHSNNNFFTSGVTVAVRKKKCKMIWTSQETSQVELRVKNRTTMFLNPTRIDMGDKNILVFKISVISKARRLMGEITLNLTPFKNDYDTYYIPLPLLDREEDEENEALAYQDMDDYEDDIKQKVLDESCARRKKSIKQKEIDEAFAKLEIDV